MSNRISGFDRIKDWIEHNNFPTREDVERYVAIHGGKSSSMDATLDFLYGQKGEERLVQPELEPVSPLEELQGIKEPQTLPEIQQEKQVEEERVTEQQTAGEIVTPAEQQTIVKRLRRFISQIFGQ